MPSTYVPPTGNQSAKIVLCGEQPGVQEVRGKPPAPFIGPAGQELDDCLRLAGIPRFDCWLTNVIKDLDRPLEHYIDIESNNKRYSISRDGWDYINKLKDELSRVKPNVVVALGRVPLLALTNRMGITNWRSSVIESTLVPGMKVIPTFHPATIIQPKFVFLNKPLIVFDLTKAKKESAYPEIRREERNIITRPSFNQAMDVLRYAYDLGKRGRIIDLDIEVINEEVDCLAVSWDTHNSISIPFRDQFGDYFTPEQELEIMLLVAAIMEDKSVSKRGANFPFDTQFILRKYGIRPRGELHCTQIAQKIAFPDYFGRLPFVTSMHTDIPYYKEEGKKWMKMGAGTWEEWWHYNGMDAIATSAAHPSQMQDLIRQGNVDTYNRQRKLIPPLLYMMERGIRVDVSGLLKQKEKEEKELGVLVESLNKEVGYELDYNSPKQVMNYFYRKLGIKPYKKKNTAGKWVETSDVDALKRLARRDIKAARIMLDIRGLAKRISTYLNIRKVDNDSRYRSAYNPVGAETGRLSSGETIFNTGGNQQNWPHDLLRYFLFDEGYAGYSFDASQIENRIVAYVGNIIPMIQAFESGIDLHRLTASLVLGKPFDQISDEDGSCNLGDGRQSERFWGKKANHGLNYDLGYAQFALKYEVAENQAKWIVERYHRAYPGVRQNYHAMIQRQLKTNRTITNLFDRKRVFLGPVISNPPAVPLNACHKTYKEAYAHLPQSTTADKINEQGVEFIYYNQQMFKPVELLAQIHDSVVFQIPLSVPWIEHARMLLQIKRSLETPMKWHDTEFVVPADLAFGWNMCKEEMAEFKSKNIPKDAEEFAHKLEESWQNLMFEKKGYC